jgi:hypothetical protein
MPRTKTATNKTTVNLMPTSIYLDSKLFPKPTELCIMPAAQFMGARLRSGPGQYTIRADLTLAAFDSTSLLGKTSYLIAANVKEVRGVTLLRQLLGRVAEAFDYVIFDPAQPEVVTFIGPRRMPNPLPEGHSLADLDSLLVRFPELSAQDRALVAMLKFARAHGAPTDNPTDNPNGHHFDLGNGWSVFVTHGISPVFTLTENAPAEEDCARDNSYSLPA